MTNNLPDLAPLLHLASYATLADRVADRLAARRRGLDPLEPWSEEIIVASAGVAETIATRLLERLPGGMAGLRIRTIDAFAEHLTSNAGEYPRVAPEGERRLAMRAAAQAVDHPMLETRGAAAILERSYRDLRDSGLTVVEFATRARKSTSLRSGERVRILIRVWTEYERLIRLSGAIDPADLLAQAERLITSSAAVRPQIVAGFYDMTGAQLRVISALQQVDKLAAVCIPVEPEHADHYAFANPLLRRFSPSALGPQPSVLRIRKTRWTISEHRTREEEARGVCRAVAALLEKGEAPSAIGIAGRTLEPYDIHLLRRFSAELGFTISAPEVIPLPAHRIGRGLLMLLRLRERDFPRGDVLEIVRAGLRVQTRINVDKADVETRQAQIAGGRSAALRSRASRSPVIADYVALVEELERMTERIDGRFLAGAGDFFRLEHEDDLAAAEAMDQIGALFLRAERWSQALDIASVVDALEQVALSCQQSTANHQPVVWTGDVMRFRGRAFEHLFAIRMQDGVVPQRRVEDPLLPDSDRRALGVREIGDGRDEERLLFHLLRAGASGAIHFSYASSDGFGKPLRPSPYLKLFTIEQEPEARAEILKNFSRFAAAHALTTTPIVNRQPLTVSRMRPLQLIARSGTRGVFDGYVQSPVIRARAAVALQAISPTQLEDFGECPQKFLLKHVLRVKAVEDPEREVQINHRDKGILDHAILEKFYRTITPDEIAQAADMLPRLPPGLADRLLAVVDEEFDRVEAEAPPFNRPMRSIERRATKRILREFIATDLAELIALGLTPRRFEFRFGTKHRHHVPDHPDPFVLETCGIPLRVEGTIDRIDEGGGGAYRIVDYKSGKAKRHENLGEKIDRGVRLQLALYSMAVADFFAVDPAAVAGAIKPLVASEAAPEKFSFVLGARRDRLRETLHLFVRTILDGAFPAFPNQSDDEFNSCKYCPVNHSCRTKHDAEESRAVLRYNEPRSLLESP